MRRTTLWRLGCLALAVAGTACNDEAVPTAPDDASETLDAPEPPRRSFEGNAVFDDRAHALTDEDFELRSSAAELEAGLYRLVPRGETIPDLVRDEFIVTPDGSGATVVRRVLDASVEDGELRIDTGPAHWYDIIRSGTYDVTMPIGGDGDARFVDPAGVSYGFAQDGVTLPALEATFADEDVCQWLHDVLDLIPGAKERRVCGKEVEMEVAYGVSLGIAGTLDSLRILAGNVRLTGEMDVSMTIDGGGISGGRAPSFYPCNLRAYPGCLATPTGAALVEFFRAYVPALPEASLPPVRVCVPGSPIRVQRGYWSGFTWHPPVWRRCTVADFGELPTIVLPSVESTANEVRPHLTGDMTMRAVGDGAFTLEIPIPGLGAKAGYSVTNDLKMKAAIGIFVTLKTTLKNGGGTVRVTFDDTGRVTQSWTNTVGWDQDFELVDGSHHAELLDLTNPDSVVLRVGIPIKANAEVCIALVACGKTDEEGGDPDTEFQLDILGQSLFGGTGLNLGANLGVGFTFFEEITYTREQVGSDDDDVDNWHLSGDAAYDLTAKAGVHIPLTGWILPNVPREIGDTWECCRVPVADYWGQGRVEVSTTTTGVDVDPDGYEVLVEQMEVPEVMDAGAQRIGSGWPARTFHETVDADGQTTFGRIGGALPCIAVYSDAYLIGNPVWGLSLAGARAAGVDIPTYGATSSCRWLIGRYKITLADVASNCTVEGGAVRDSVWLQQRRFTEPKRDDIRHVHFDVACGVAGAQGVIEAVLSPGGRGEVPPILLVDGATTAVFEGDTVTIGGLEPGTYEVGLEGLAPLCSSAPEPALVVGGQTTTVTPLVVCAAYDPQPGTVTYAASMTGDGPDENGYGLLVDGAPRAHLEPDGSGAVAGLAASTPRVFAVTDIAANCQAQMLNPRVITLDASASPVTVPFPVECTTAQVDTLEGTLDASGWPTPTVTVRAEDGTTLVVLGPKTDELTRLTGSPVRMWGTTSATGIDVYGYDLESHLGDDRWLGIVLDRTDGLWLFGDQALRLVDPPSGLAGESGSLVWVMGREVDGGVQPTLYGVIRGG